VSRLALRPVGILRDERRTNPWLDVAFGVVLATPVALIMSQIEQADFRTGALAIAFVVVVGLAVTWQAALGAAPVVFVGAWFQDADGLGDVPSARHLVGLAMFALSLAVVVFALRRWEGDRRKAREAAAAVSRNERRLIALVDFAQQLAGVPDHAGVMRVVADDVTVTAGANGAILVNEDRNRVEFLVVAGHDPPERPHAFVGRRHRPILRRVRRLHRDTTVVLPRISIRTTVTPPDASSGSLANQACTCGVAL